MPRKKLYGAAKHSRRVKRAIKTKRSAGKLYSSIRKEIRTLEVLARGLYGKAHTLTSAELGKLEEVRGHLHGVRKSALEYQRPTAA